MSASDRPPTFDGVPDMLARADDTDALFRLIVERSSDMLVQYDPKGIIIYASPSARQFGLDPERMVGRSFAEFIDVGDGQPKGNHARLLAGLPFVELPPEPFKLRTEHDGRLWVQGNPTLIRDAAGEVVAVVTSIRDVTYEQELREALQAKQAETEAALRQARESEARYRELADHSIDLILRYDMQGVVQYASPALLPMFGYEPASAVGWRMTRIPGILGQKAQETLKALAEGQALPAGDDNEGPVTHADGRTVWIQGNPSAIYDEAGAPIGVMTIVRDITERKAANDELARSQAEAQAAAAAKAEFLANMSHEIRTPLTGVLGYAGLLQKIPDLPEKAVRYVERIIRSGDGLLAIVNNILDFSKLEAGRFALNPAPTKLDTLLSDTLEVIRPLADEKHLELSLDLPPHLPSSVIVDGGRLSQVLLNLLGNAVKFTQAGRVALQAVYDSGADSLRLSVSDTGPGVPAAIGDVIFQRFSQVDGSSTRQFGGAGLGLAIVKGLVELMGGRVGYESTPGLGATFWLEIPLVACGPQSNERHLGGAEPELPTLDLLLVDDLEINRELVQALLSPFDVQITEAVDGVGAVAACAKRRFDLILMDLQMPQMDGLQATRAIRSGGGPNAGTPIVALSANVLATHVDACREAGMDDHLGKPISPHELLTTIARWTTTEGRPPRKTSRAGGSG